MCSLSGRFVSNNFMNTKSISSLTFGLFVLGSGSLIWGLVRLFDAVQSGLKQGFGPNATLVVMGRIGYQTISLQGELRASCVPIFIGAVLIGVLIWSVRHANSFDIS